MQINEPGQKNDHCFVEGTGGPFSKELLERTPPGTILCSDDSILDKNMSTIDRRIFKFATPKKEKYFTASTGEDDSRCDTVFIDSWQEIVRDPNEIIETRKTAICSCRQNQIKLRV